MQASSLEWLPVVEDWQAKSQNILKLDHKDAWAELVRISNSNMDMLRTARVDNILSRILRSGEPKSEVAPPIRVAMLGSSTLGHLTPGIRVGLLRRSMYPTVYEPDYGQYFQELYDSNSGLHAFNPNVVVFAFDAYHLTVGVDALTTKEEVDGQIESIIENLKVNWTAAKKSFNCSVIQQSAMPLFPAILGNNEFRLPNSKKAFVTRLNAAMREAATVAGVDILALDDLASADGLNAWHDPSLWCRAKQEVSPLVAHLYGDALASLIAAQRGKSYKCLVLDLDNTLWGGVIGDDGLDGIELGQGSARGEAFLQVQRYALAQARRGVILAVVSKNDEANALLPFESHPEMLLKKEDIACFIANWDDKATNLRRVASQLNIGVDSLVFLDDNPFERELVRQELPMVAVPEVSENVTAIPNLLARAGYFEGTAVTAEDLERTKLYFVNRQRTEMLASATDLDGYLRNLEMRLLWSKFDTVNLPRVVQLINKTNQFNLTTRRYSDSDAERVRKGDDELGLHFRLLDRFGDNGIVGVIIARKTADEVLEIDTWLMSCRVLGRNVEKAMLEVLVECAKEKNVSTLVGRYIPTKKNEMVREHYKKLGFENVHVDELGESTDRLILSAYEPGDIAMEIEGLNT